MQRKVERRHVPQAQKTEGARRQFEQLLASLEYASDASTTAGELRHHQLQLQQQLQDTQATLLVVERSCHHCQGQAGSATLQHPEQRAAVQWPELDQNALIDLKRRTISYIAVPCLLKRSLK